MLINSQKYLIYMEFSNHKTHFFKTEPKKIEIKQHPKLQNFDEVGAFQNSISFSVSLV